MLIPVIYKNGNHDQVKDFMLSRLIDDHGIAKFKRSSGWVTIGVDRIRNLQKTTRYSGEERRQEEVKDDLIDIF